jgi:hypothetical protein
MRWPRSFLLIDLNSLALAVFLSTSFAIHFVWGNIFDFLFSHSLGIQVAMFKLPGF